MQDIRELEEKLYNNYRGRDHKKYYQNGRLASEETKKSGVYTKVIYEDFERYLDEEAEDTFGDYCECCGIDTTEDMICKKIVIKKNGYTVITEYRNREFFCDKKFYNGLGHGEWTAYCSFSNGPGRFGHEVVRNLFVNGECVSCIKHDEIFVPTEDEECRKVLKYVYDRKNTLKKIEILSEDDIEQLSDEEYEILKEHIESNPMLFAS